MDEPTVVLASASPRRLELLGRLGLQPSVIHPEVDESPRPGESPQALVRRLAIAKVQAVEAAPDCLVIAADTVVVVEGDVLGKPKDHEEAVAMVRRLGGRTHAVLTGVAVRRGQEMAHDVVRTEVTFRPVSDVEARWYVATGEPFDKAGGYGVQGAAGAFVVGVNGSDTNVIGLPLSETVTLARQVGVELLSQNHDTPA